MTGACLCCLKKHMNASRPSEHPPVGGKMSKRLLILAVVDDSHIQRIILATDESTVT